jgi:hypothetical protein
MAEPERRAVGLSVGATNLAAVTADRAVIRKSVVTLYRQRPPEVGVPPAHSEPTEPGLTITGFVDRVGDPGGVSAADGSTHRGETVLAEGLRVLAAAATDESTRPEVVAVTYPAHWRPPAVDALSAALDRLPEWSGARVSLLPDFAAALTALQADSGLPSRGIIAVCDFGGSGSSLTLVDAAHGYRAVGPTVRHPQFCGDLIDQAMLDQVVADLSASGAWDTSATSAVGSLTALRAACRRAKEELSSTTETTLTAELPGFRRDLRVTRSELDDAIRQPLDGFVSVVQETLRQRGIRAADVVAAVSVGGGASIPSVTRTVIEHLRVPVISTPRPHLAAAIGAALRAAQGPIDGDQTGLAPTAAELGSLTEAKTAMEIPAETEAPVALAWSEVDDDSDIVLPVGEYPEPESVGDDEELTYSAWYQRLEVVLVGVLLLVVIILATIMLVLRHPPGGGGPTTPAPSVSSTPPPTTEQSPSTQTSTEVSETYSAPPPPPAPPPETSIQPPPPPPPAPTTQPPPEPPPSTPAPTTQPPPTAPPTTQAPTTVPPRHRPTNPFTPRNPSAPNPFTPKNPFAPANPGF